MIGHCIIIGFELTMIVALAIILVDLIKLIKEKN